MRIQSEIQRERETIRVPAELYVKHPVVTLGCPPAQHFNPPNLRHPHFVFVDRCIALDRHTARF